MSLVYISHATSGDIHTFELTYQGYLSLMDVSVLGGNLAPMAISHIKHALYVARRGDQNALISLAIDESSGKLQLNAETPVGAKMSYLSIDRSGRYLVGVSYHSHTLTVCPIDQAGHVLPTQAVIPTLKHPHSMLFTQDNKHALVASLGGDAILVYAFDENTGQLTELEQHHWVCRSGCGPRHIQFHPHGEFVYVLNELDATLDVLHWNNNQAQLNHLQTLATLPAKFTDQPWAADIHLTPNGRFLYTSDRNASTLALFSLNQTTGLATFIAHTDTELRPRSFAINPSGTHLLAAGQQSNHVSLYRIDAATGQLEFQQKLPTGIEPIWIEII
jgi:6-phosphogluconolactonase